MSKFQDQSEIGAAPHESESEWVCGECSRRFPTRDAAVGHLEPGPRYDGYHFCHGEALKALEEMESPRPGVSAGASLVPSHGSKGHPAILPSRAAPEGVEVLAQTKDSILDAIDDWHQGRGGAGQELHEYLGMTWQEYARFVETGVLP